MVLLSVPACRSSSTEKVLQEACGPASVCGRVIYLKLYYVASERKSIMFNHLARGGKPAVKSLGSFERAMCSANTSKGGKKRSKT